MKFDLNFVPGSEYFTQALGVTDERGEEIADFILTMVAQGCVAHERDEFAMENDMTYNLKKIVEFAQSNEELVVMIWMFSMISLSTDIYAAGEGVITFNNDIKKKVDELIAQS